MYALDDFSTGAPAAPMLPVFGPAAESGPVFPSFGAAPPLPAVRARHPAPAPALDSLSAAELRKRLAGDFKAARDWFSLCSLLRRKGFSLRLREGDLWICDAGRRAPLASCEALGIDLAEAELRFGPPQPKRAAA